MGYSLLVLALAQRCSASFLFDGRSFDVNVGCGGSVEPQLVYVMPITANVLDLSATSSARAVLRHVAACTDESEVE